MEGHPALYIQLLQLIFVATDDPNEALDIDPILRLQIVQLRNPNVRNSATPLPKMPRAHEACAHLAGAYRI
jgi:hypothetical protein